MKGINVKKIAAFAGAAVLFGASVAVADVVYGNMQLVDQNGQPTVKVVVGSKAAITDGVAAANIAAKIANEAYKSSTLTAGLSGEATCSVGTGTSGAGSCSLVESSKKVTLEVTLPGTIAGTHTFKTLITDTIDKTLANRNSTRDEDMFAALKSSSDTSTETSPLRAYSENGTIAKNLYKIGSGQFTGFADFAITDTNSAGTSYTEEQAFWIGSGNDAVKYDTDSSIRDVAVNTYSAMVYSAKFAGNDFGIPVCTGGLSSNTTDDWTSCDSNGNDMTERHRVKIKFMGSEWIISEMKDPAVSNPSQTAVVNGGQIKLAKEAKYGIINVGGELDAGTFKVRLSDISVAVGSANEHPAIIDVLDAASEQVVGQIQVTPGTTYTFTQSGTNNLVKIHVYKTAPGFTLNAKWAEMAVYTDEVTLKDTKTYNLVSSSDTNKNFKVSLLWKNRDFPGGVPSVAAANKTDSLRQIVIYDVDTFTGNKYKAGDVYSFLKSPSTFKLTYNGVDLTDSDYEPVSISALSKISNLRVAVGAGGDTACADTSAGDYSYTGKFIQVKSNGNLFGGSGLLGSYMVDKFYIDPIGVTGGNSTTPNGTQAYANSTAYVLSPKIFFQPSGQNCWKYVAITPQAITGVTDLANAVKFETAGDNSAAYGAIYLNTANAQAGFDGNIVMQEDAGKVDTASNYKVLLAVPYNLTATATSDDPFRFKSSDSATAKIWYKGIRDASMSDKELTFVTERGTKATNLGTTDATVKVAKKVGMPTFQFAYSDTTVSTGADTYELKVGDSQVFGGVTVKVKAIDATTGSCSVLGPGGAPACTVDSSAVGAVIKPDNAASVEVSQPVKLQSKLVVMDTAASGIGPVITVGGPLVNTVTADALKDAAVDFNTMPVYVKEIGNKIVVAGKTADDTMAAADAFIRDVKRQ